MEIKKDLTEYREGEYILFTEGEYSDYHPNQPGLFKVLKDFDFRGIEVAIRVSYGLSTYTHDEGIAQMIRDGLIEEVDYRKVSARGKGWYHHG